MAVSSTATFDLNRDQLIRRSCQRAALCDAGGEPDPDTIAMAADFLQVILLDLANEGVTLWQKERTTQALLASTAEYSLDADTIDVAVGPDGFAGTIVDADGNETRVKAIDGHEYTLLSNKDAEATTPTFVYIEKRSTVRLLFWPEPSAATTFRYQKVRLIRDMDTGTVTADAPKRWLRYLFYQLAADLAGASSKPDQFVSKLEQNAKEAKDGATRTEKEPVHGQFYVPRYGGGCV